MDFIINVQPGTSAGSLWESWPLYILWSQCHPGHSWAPHPGTKVGVLWGFLGHALPGAGERVFFLPDSAEKMHRPVKKTHCPYRGLVGLEEGLRAVSTDPVLLRKWVRHPQFPDFSTVWGFRAKCCARCGPRTHVLALLSNWPFILNQSLCKSKSQKVTALILCHLYPGSKWHKSRLWSRVCGQRMKHRKHRLRAGSFKWPPFCSPVPEAAPRTTAATTLLHVPSSLFRLQLLQRCWRAGSPH